MSRNDRRYGVIAAVTLMLVTSLFASVPVSAAGAFDSAYRFESAFLSGLQPGQTGQLSVFFDNTGTSAWVVGTDTQVNLAACRADQITCNLPSDKSSWNPGTWLSSTAYATHAKNTVVPGDFSAFTYSVKVPSEAPLGTYRFNGDLVLASTGERLHPEGYYQDVSTSALVIPPGAAAPVDVRTLVGNYNGASNANSDDVRISFTAPAANTIQSYELQRASSACPVTATSTSFGSIATLTAVPGQLVETRDFDRPSGSYCYQVRTKEPTTNAYAYSNQDSALINVTGDSTKPTASSMILRSSGGGTSYLDASDTFTITFTEAMTFSSTANTVIRVVDADCGSPASQNSGPAQCAPTKSQTIAEVICGQNATCYLSFEKVTLTVAMNFSPRIVSEGSGTGVLLPVVVTEIMGLTDTAGNPFDLALSNDRSFGPLGQ